MSANRRRGEVAAFLDGRERKLRLTLGGLAELEAAFAVDDLNALAARFSSGRLAARDMALILAAGLRGAGDNVSDEEVFAMHCENGVQGMAGIVADLLTQAFGAQPGEPSDRP